MSELVALLDVDGTLLRGWMLMPWIDELALKGYVSGPKIGSLQALPTRYAAGEVTHDELAEYGASLCAEILRELPADQSHELAEAFVDEHVKELLFPYVPSLIEGLHSAGLRVVLVTGAPSELAEPFRELIGADEAVAMTHDNGIVRFTPGTSQAKATTVADVVSRGAEVALAAGDSESDLPLLGAARVKLVVGRRLSVPETWHSTIVIDPTLADGPEVLRMVLAALQGR